MFPNLPGRGEFDGICLAGSGGADSNTAHDSDGCD